VIDLCRAALGWSSQDHDEAFFAWKHDENPAGVSPQWGAFGSDGELVGVRVFLRWRFRGPRGEVLHGVRAVDTATHPDHQGRGIFSRLTLGALPELREMGTDFVFNTPNAQSRPGYLKMGWNLVGRIPVAVRVAGPRSAAAMRGARAAAEKWSQPTQAGIAATDALADSEALSRLLDRLVPSGRIETDRTVEHLQWRYRFEPLHYRAIAASSVADGLVIFRVRRRGSALEATVCETLMPPQAATHGLYRRILDETGADYLIRAGWTTSGVRDGFVPTPRLGPILTWKPLGRVGAPRMAELDFSLGDIELF
jgi:GNAT superfamily N-acetyltransferase